MKRSEAYHILGDLWGKVTPEQAEAISMAQNDIEFVDLMPDDMVAVVRCKDCKHHERDQDACHGRTQHYCKKLKAEVYKDFFCARGERKDGDG